MYWKQLINTLRLQILLISEVFKMNFSKNSMIAQCYVILILAGEITIDNVPNIGNLQSVVMEILGTQVA